MQQNGITHRAKKRGTNYCRYANERIYEEHFQTPALIIGEKRGEYSDDATFIDLSGADYNCDVNKGLPIFDCKFKHIRMGEILEHIENDAKLLREARELLANDGTLLITVPYYGEADYHLRLHNEWSIRQLLKVTGWSVVHYVPRNMQRFDRLIAYLRGALGQWVNRFAFLLNDFLPLKTNGAYLICMKSIPVDLVDINRKEFT